MLDARVHEPPVTAVGDDVPAGHVVCLCTRIDEEVEIAHGVRGRVDGVGQSRVGGSRVLVLWRGRVNAGDVHDVRTEDEARGVALDRRGPVAGAVPGHVGISVVGERPPAVAVLVQGESYLRSRTGDRGTVRRVPPGLDRTAPVDDNGPRVGGCALTGHVLDIGAVGVGPLGHGRIGGREPPAVHGVPTQVRGVEMADLYPRKGALPDTDLVHSSV